MSIRSRIFRSAARSEELKRESHDARVRAIENTDEQMLYGWFSQIVADEQGWAYECSSMNGSTIMVTHLLAQQTTHPPAPDAQLVGIAYGRGQKVMLSNNKPVISNNITVSCDRGTYTYDSTSRRTLGELYLGALSQSANDRVEVSIDNDIAYSGSLQNLPSNLKLPPTSRITIRMFAGQVNLSTIQAVAQASAQATVAPAVQTMRQEVNRNVEAVRAQMDRSVNGAHERVASMTAEMRRQAERIEALKRTDREIQEKLHQNKPISEPKMAPIPTPRSSPTNPRTYMDYNGNTGLSYSAYKNSTMAFIRSLRTTKKKFYTTRVRSLAPAHKSRALRRGWGENTVIIVSDGLQICTENEWREFTGSPPSQHPACSTRW